MMNPFRAIGYSLWIGKEIVTGTVDVLTGIFKAGEYGRPMIVELPLRCETDVEIKIECCGVCASDLHTARSGWGPTKYPCVVG